MLKSLAREPLVHFLLLGALLFALDAWLRPAPTAGSPGGEIVISEARVRSMAQNFARTWQRTPTREEIDGLVESFVREEVMVREALALGLDRDDPIIRRRLQQKVEFVSEQGAALARPTDDELRAYLKAHPEAFVIEPRVTFEQITLDPTRRADAAADARRLLEQLNRAGGKADATALGDRLLLLEPRYEAAPQAEVARLFGAEFAAALPRQPVGRWVGPIASGYGLHLVRIEGIEPGGTPALDEVRPQVEREWTNNRRQELSKALYDKLRAKYTVTVRMPEAPKP
jgi:PPIC-type PPIASE domain